MEIFVLNRSPSTLYIVIYAMEMFVLNRSFFEFPTANFFEKKKAKHFIRESHRSFHIFIYLWLKNIITNMHVIFTYYNFLGFI